MGLYYIFGLCLAFFSFSTLASDSPRIAYDPATTSYYTKPDFLKSPVGSSSTRIVTPLLVDKTSDGALKQKMQGGLIIEAKQVRAPFSAYVKAGVDSTKIAASRCLSSMRCNVGLVLAGEGLSKLLDGLDWVMGEGGQIQKKEENNILDSAPEYTDYATYPPYNCGWGASCWEGKNYSLGRMDGGNKDWYWCTNEANLSGNFYFGGYYGGVCYYTRQPNGFVGFDYSPLSSSEIADSVNSNYIPEPSDWSAIAGDLPLSNPDVVVGIDSFPDFSLAPETRTIYDADGNAIEVTKTTNTFSFSTNSSSNPSKRPEVSIKEKTTSETFKDGQSQGKTESEKTSSPADVDAPTTVVGGGGNKTPTDCAFFPTLCKWLDWTQEDVGEEPDLSKIINDEDFERNYSINFGDNSCPQPISIDIAFLDKTIELSYQPACDLMGYARPFVLISAYIFAIYIGLGVVRNG